MSFFSRQNTHDYRGDEAVDLVFFAFEHGQNCDILVQTAPACIIQTQAEAVFELFVGQYFRFLFVKVEGASESIHLRYEWEDDYSLGNQYEEYLQRQ